MRETIFKPLLLPGLCLFVLTGCLDDDDGNGSGSKTGTLTSVGVENLSYETRSTSGTTGEDGRFEYLPGETISFSIGNLPITSDVPTAPFLTSMDFTEEQRRELQQGGINEKGLQTHRVAEEALARSNRIAINTMRLIMILGQDLQTSPTETIQITDRTIEQLNSYLAKEEPEIDFSQPVASFASPSAPEYDNEGNLIDPSPVNRMLDSICFEPEGDELCDPPPSRDDIEDTTDDEARQELEQERQQILDARRTLSEVSSNSVTDFLLTTTEEFRLDLEGPYFLAPETVTLSPDATDIQKIRIRRIGSQGANLQANALDARALDDGLTIHSANWQTGEVEFFQNNSGTEETTILINFKVETPDFENYRWFTKTVKVFH